jgi:hypothetical protein
MCERVSLYPLLAHKPTYRVEKESIMPTEKLDRWKSELSHLEKSITWRWGDTRRFQSNSRKIERRQWLIDHIYDAEHKRLKGSFI